MPLIADVNISSESLTAVGGVVVTLWAAIIMLWRQQVADTRASLEDARAERRALLELLIQRGLALDAARVLEEARKKTQSGQPTAPEAGGPGRPF